MTDRRTERQQRLRAICAQRGIKGGAALHRLTQVPEPTCRAYLGGHRPLTVLGAKLLAPALGVTWQWLMLGDAPDQTEIDEVAAEDEADRAELPDPRTLIRQAAAAVRAMLREEAVKMSPEQVDGILADIFYSISTAPLRSNADREAALIFEINRRREDLRRSYQGKDRKRQA